MHPISAPWTVSFWANHPYPEEENLVLEFLQLILSTLMYINKWKENRLNKSQITARTKKNQIYTTIQKEHYYLVEAYCFNIHCTLMLVCLPGISLRHLAFHMDTSSCLAINLTGLSPSGRGLFILCRSCWDSSESSPLFENVWYHIYISYLFLLFQYGTSICILVLIN